MKYTENYFKKYVDASIVKTNFDIPSNHAWIIKSPKIGNACQHFGTPYLNHCDFDLAGAMLAHLKVADLQKPLVEADASGLRKFDQAKYVPSGHTAYGIAMAQNGYVYVPQRCATDAMQNCKIHVMYHGCGQSAGYIGSELAKNGGFNAHAETNGIVVLYPQAINNPNFGNTVRLDDLFLPY